MSHSLQALIAEVTHRCPLHCVYCSNPRELQKREDELSTDEWARVFNEAAELGALQLHLTGGEPLARQDIVQLVRAARRAGMYVNLITSGVGLTAERLDSLVASDLDHIQLSFQDADENFAKQINGTRTHALKLKAAEMIRSRPVAFTVNIVVHRQNLDRLEAMIALAEQSGARRLEIAHVQYYGWAFANREALLPTREQLDMSVRVVEAARERLNGRLKIDFVLPDYYARFPKPCMNGWGRQQMLIDPRGRALPCHSAGILPDMELSNVSEHTLRWIWETSPSFNRYRGTEWLPQPCRTCDRAELDFGGCRCQAYLLTGNAASPDPVCTLVPSRSLVNVVLAAVNAKPSVVATSAALIYRIESSENFESSAPIRQ